MRVVRVFLCLLLAALAACDGDRPERPQPQVPQREADQPPAPVVAPPPVVTPRAVEPSPAAPPVTARPLPERPATPIQAVPSRPPVPASPVAPVMAPLDLSLPDELLERLADDQPLAVAEPAPLLPPLFGDKPQAPQSFELGGRLITSERSNDDEDIWHELEGAELELRFRR